MLHWFEMGGLVPHEKIVDSMKLFARESHPKLPLTPKHNPFGPEAAESAPLEHRSVDRTGANSPRSKAVMHHPSRRR